MLLKMLLALLRFALFVPNVLVRWQRYISYSLYGKSLEGKVVLITGASSGIGRALAFELYSAGCRVILASRNTEALYALRTELIKTNGHNEAAVTVPVVVKLDLSDPAQLVESARDAEKIFGTVDILVNNGGISVRSSVNDAQMPTFRRVMEINYFGAVTLTKCLLPGMLTRGRGHVVNVSSLQGLFSIPHRSAYAASKHALQAFSDSLRAEVAKDNVAVTVVSPGYVDTLLSVHALTGSGQKYGIRDETQSHGYAPAYVARVIRESIALKQKEVVIAPFHHRIIAYIRYLWPQAYFWAMTQRAIDTADKQS